MPVTLSRSPLRSVALASALLAAGLAWAAPSHRDLEDAAVSPATSAAPAQQVSGEPNAAPKPDRQRQAMQLQYLEFVTPEVDATCALLEKQHGVTFSKPDPKLGNARTADLKGGGRLGVRAPMHEAETPVVRPYRLVADIEAAVEAAKAAGAEIAHPPLEIPGHGTFAIYIQGGLQHGLWEN